MITEIDVFTDTIREHNFKNDFGIKLTNDGGHIAN